MADHPRAPKTCSHAHVKAFPLLRPEKGRWYWAGIGVWALLLVWMWFSRDQLKPWSYLSGVILFSMALVKDVRMRLTPNRRVEIDEQGIRLFPQGYWIVDEIAWDDVMGRREESSGIFLHFKDEGTERAVEFERRLFSKECWRELAGWLQGDTKLVAREW